MQKQLGMSQDEMSFMSEKYGKLHVRDQSKFTIYGKYNKGTINVPNERTYTLEVDSINMKIK